MKSSPGRSTLPSLALAGAVACLVSWSTSWAQSPPVDVRAALDPMIRAVMQIQDRHTDRLLAIPGVVGTATTTLPNGQHAVKILTRYRSMERFLPEVLEDTPVIVEEVGEIRALEYTGVFTPVPAGVSVGNINECSAGTIGAVVKKDGIDYWLSNNHVLARENHAALGEDIVQPGRYDSVPQCDSAYPNAVADLSQFAKLRWGYFGSNKIDAAIAQIRGGVAHSCATACGYTPSSTPATAALDLAVKKCGRTTELTTGQVTGINVTVYVSYSGGRLARFVNQIQFGNISSPGDSGSLIVTEAGNNPVALLFAGSATTTIGNPISEVTKAFGVSICGS